MRPRTTPFGRAVATAGAGSLAAGLAFGNFVYLLLGGFLLATLLLARPNVEPRIERRVEPATVRAGETVTVAREVVSPVPVLLHDRLPDAFDVDGSNLRLVRGNGDASYSALARRRGEHKLPPTTVLVPDPIGAAEPASFEAADEVTLVVEATSPRLGRVRSPQAWGRSMYAEGDRTPRGPRTNEFRELRPYEPGDPLKIVNWRATARASTGDDLVLLVNEYEPEGKKSVWIFLDTTPATARGTTVRNLLDVLVEGALSAADHYLARGHRVGIATFGGAPQLLYPDHGRAQYRRLVTLLTYLEPATSGGPASSLAEAVEAARGFLVREKPLLLLFSSLSTSDEAEGLGRAQVLAATGRRPAPAILVATSFAEVGSPDAVIDRLAGARHFALTRVFAGRGVRVLRWNPDEAPLGALLASGAR